MFSSAIRNLCFLSVLVSALGASAAPRGFVDLPAQAGASYSAPGVSMKEQRFQKTLHQQYDFSCGSAALATLLTHHSVSYTHLDVYKRQRFPNPRLNWGELALFYGNFRLSGHSLSLIHI